MVPFISFVLLFCRYTGTPFWKIAALKLNTYDTQKYYGNCEFKVIPVGSSNEGYKVMFQSVETGKYLYKKGQVLIDEKNEDELCSWGVKPENFECLENRIKTKKTLLYRTCVH